MTYDTRLIEATVHPDKIEWSCQCGFRFTLAYTAYDTGIGYLPDEFSYCVTGGVSESCPKCQRRYFLPCMATVPSVSEVVPRT